MVSGRLKSLVEDKNDKTAKTGEDDDIISSSDEEDSPSFFDTFVIF